QRRLGRRAAVARGRRRCLVGAQPGAARVPAAARAVYPGPRRGRVAVHDPRLRADQAAGQRPAVPVQVRQPGERAPGRAAPAPPAPRGCVPPRERANALPFQSKYANQETVRQVVLRLRGVLTEVGVGGLLAVAPGRGYYLASPVTVGTTSLPEPLRR